MSPPWGMYEDKLPAAAFALWYNGLGHPIHRLKLISFHLLTLSKSLSSVSLLAPLLLTVSHVGHFSRITVSTKPHVSLKALYFFAAVFFTFFVFSAAKSSPLHDANNLSNNSPDPSRSLLRVPVKPPAIC